MTKRRVDWKGSFPAIMTPFTKDGALDEPIIRANVRMTVDEGAHGLVIVGHNGEAHLMSEAERERVVTIAVEEVNGRIPVIAGTGEINTDTVIRQTKAAMAAGADGVMVEAPYFMRPQPDDIVAHYARISDACDIPIKMYNNPARAGIDLKPAIVDKCADMANIVSIKDSCGDFVRLMQYLQALGDRMLVFCGPARLYGYAAISMGCAGFVDGLPQVTPKAIELYSLAAANDAARGVPLQHDLFRLGQALNDVAGTAPATVKDAMRILGRPGGWSRPPLRAMEGENLRQLEVTLKSLGLTPQAAAAE